MSNNIEKEILELDVPRGHNPLRPVKVGVLMDVFQLIMHSDQLDLQLLENISPFCKAWGINEIDEVFAIAFSEYKKALDGSQQKLALYAFCFNHRDFLHYLEHHPDPAYKEKNSLPWVSAMVNVYLKQGRPPFVAYALKALVSQASEEGMIHLLKAFVKACYYYDSFEPTDHIRSELSAYDEGLLNELIFEMDPEIAYIYANDPKAIH